ncbi:GlxA family transcriptional regulator [Vogesella sp. LIG4]|uniref:GlxA family transcriptional regulator n=1 Tax=Vogesella sp. LIG4 TaxID=1192162 RepID=UPI00081F878D|nr:helix-turn-helix domain-containing protein [Vogesella sp. LIG4]SCK24917.1 transcriptional regulator, AraC family with amidase-like domain [Vogesella sp. LIG4]
MSSSLPPPPVPASNTAAAPEVRFLLLPLPEFSLLPFGGFLDKLRFSADEADYSRQRHCEWRVLGLSAGHIVSSSGVATAIQVTPGQIRLADYDYLVVFGGRTARGSQALGEAYGGLLREAAAQGVPLVSVDNACFMLAAAGLLNGYRVALHWRHVQEFHAAFPHIRVVEEQLYCFDGPRISCAGGSAAIDLAVELLARHLGRIRALKGLADMLVDAPRAQGHQLSSLDEDAHAGRHVGRAIALMRSRLADKTGITELAALVGLSRRQLDRLFHAEFSLSAHDYWQEMRLQHVRWRLLNSDHSLALLADEIGLQDASYLCKVFRKRFGQSPDTLRRQPH